MLSQVIKMVNKMTETITFIHKHREILVCWS